MDMSRILSDYAVTFPADQLPDRTVRHTQSLLTDTIGCILSGSSEQAVSETIRIIDCWGGRPQASIFSFGRQTAAPFAALANAVMGHANDYDDTHDPALNHGCVTIVPALLAVIESLPDLIQNQLTGPLFRPVVTGRDLIAALAIGLDISNRFGMAFIPYLHTGWLPTTLWGPFACVAACGRILGLDKDQMHHAFGFAYAQIHANRQALADGALAKRMQPGFSAMAGIQSVCYAVTGLTAATHIIDGVFGLPQLYTNGQVDSRYLTEHIGQSFETDRVSLKPYPSCRCTHPVIDAALQIKHEHQLDWQSIESGYIYLPPMSMGQIGRSFSIRNNPVVDAQFSAQYTAALAFIRGRPSLADFKADRINADKTVQALANRFKTVEYREGKPGLIPIEFHLKTRSGNVIKTVIRQAKGTITFPMSESERKEKFADCLDNGIDTNIASRKDALFNWLNQIDNVSDVSQISHVITDSRCWLG